MSRVFHLKHSHPARVYDSTTSKVCMPTRVVLFQAGRVDCHVPTADNIFRCLGLSVDALNAAWRLTVVDAATLFL